MSKEIKIFFDNPFEFRDNVFIANKKDKYTSNFSKQWRNYTYVQIDSKNNFSISENYLKSLLFDSLDILKEKVILEIGCGAGRFTEHIVKKSKLCVSVDLSEAVFHNVSKDKSNLILVKADFLELNPKKKFDFVICRGVLQHTPDPFKSIIKLYDFVKDDGCVFFDFYKMPKIGKFHPKYLYWRPLIPLLYSYEKFEEILNKRINVLLKIKRLIDIFFLNNKFFSDCIIPVWDYRGILDLKDEQLEQWAILDTLDGLFAKYDKPKTYNSIYKFLVKNYINIKASDSNKNFFKTTLN